LRGHREVETADLMLLAQLASLPPDEQVSSRNMHHPFPAFRQQ
jgi:hypothetical protein